MRLEVMASVNASTLKKWKRGGGLHNLDKAGYIV